jgi:3-oxoacyl-[acyl-carrier-protein] synthase-3
VRNNEHTITMNGKEVFKIAVRSMEEISRQALDEAGVTIDQVAMVIPHQAKDGSSLRLPSGSVCQWKE